MLKCEIASRGRSTSIATAFQRLSADQQHSGEETPRFLPCPTITRLNPSSKEPGLARLSLLSGARVQTARSLNLASTVLLPPVHRKHSCMFLLAIITSNTHDVSHLSWRAQYLARPTTFASSASSLHPPSTLLQLRLPLHQRRLVYDSS